MGLKTGGSKRVYVFVPVVMGGSTQEVARATRARAVRAEALDSTVATTAFKPIAMARFSRLHAVGRRRRRCRFTAHAATGTPVSFPVAWV